VLNSRGNCASIHKQSIMKKFISFSLVFAIASALSGCISVKTQHEVKPISITVDVNVKIDRALNDFFGDLDAQSAQLGTN